MAVEDAALYDRPTVSGPLDDGTLPEQKEIDPLPYSFSRQEVHIDVDFRNRQVSGVSEIWFTTFDSNNLPDIRIDARQCEIDLDNVTIDLLRDGQRLSPVHVLATYVDPYSLLDYPETYDWEAGNHDVRKLRILPLIETRNYDSPAENRDLTEYRPLDGALRVKVSKDLFISQRKPTLIKLKTSSVDQTSDIEHHDFVLSIPFTSKNIRDGFQFVGVDEGDTRYPHMYTRHSTEPGIASSIFPCIDDPGTLCDWKIHITCPKTLGHALKPKGHLAVEDDWRYNNLTDEDKLLDIKVICTGSKTDQIDDPNDESKYTISFSTESRIVSADKVAFAVGPFEHVDLWTQFRTEEDDEKMGTSALRVHGFCLPGRADEVRNTCAPMSMAADFLALNFSVYPFESFKMCFVDDLVPDVLPECSLAFISNRLLYPDDIIDTEIETTEKLVFSLASQWSGIQLFPNTRSDSWITLGIAWFMTDLFMRKLCGNNDHRFRIKLAADRLVEIDIDRPSISELGRFLHLGTFEQDFLQLKSRLVMFVLDKRLIKASGGSSGLTRIMSRLFLKARLASQSNDKIVSTEGFRKVCEKQGRSKLEVFWKEWVFGTGCPKLEVTPRFNKKRLCVEMTIRQTHALSDEPVRFLQKEDFLRVLLEDRNGVTKVPSPHMFTGPITIRIHEADGTPYEHIVEIRDDTGSKRVTKFEIPYNTKYKRLKRTRRMKEKQTAGKDDNVENDQEVLLYSLGDTLQTRADAELFMLREWDEGTERQMDSESYEWIRMDTDFEWIGHIRTNMPGYMYVSQLQQDRDVVAQEDTLLFIRRERPHPVASTFLIRTLMDTRYFHGIRAMAAHLLQLQATEQTDMRGMVQLMEAFKHFFCYPGTTSPKPNDFSNKQQYLIQKTIPQALSRVRDKRGKCPMKVQNFLLDLLLYNNNSDNEFSDHFYVATLITSLAHSFVPEKNDQGAFYIRSSEDDERDRDEKAVLERALEQINRFLRMDEWTNSYHNVWTIAGIEAKRALMKAGVIDIDPIDFVQYLQDETYDEIRVKAFEALVDLGLMAELPILRLLLCCLSTDRSPYIRDKLIKAFAQGLAGIAFGENTRAKPSGNKTKQEGDAERSDSILAIDGMDIDRELDADGEADDVMGDGLVVVENTAQELEARKAMFARKQNLDDAVGALRKEFEESYSDIERDIRRAVWKAVNSPVLGISEKLTLLELCSIMFEESDRFILTLKYPRRWVVSRPTAKVSGRCLVKFAPFYRTEPRKPTIAAPAPKSTTALPSPAQSSPSVAAPSPMEQQTPTAAPLKKLIINRSGSISLKTKPSIIKPVASAKSTPIKVTSAPKPTISLSIKHEPADKPLAPPHTTDSPAAVGNAVKRSAAELDNIYDTPSAIRASSTSSSGSKRPLESADETPIKRLKVEASKFRITTRRGAATSTAPARLVVTFRSRKLRHACAHKGISPPPKSGLSTTSSIPSSTPSPAATAAGAASQPGISVKTERSERSSLPDAPRHSLPDSKPSTPGPAASSSRANIKIPSKISLKTHANASPARSTGSARSSPGPPTLKSLMAAAGTPKPGRKPLPGSSGGGPSPSVARTPLVNSASGPRGNASVPSTPIATGAGSGPAGGGSTVKPRIKLMVKKPSAPPP
ncbi:Transcription initiation factor TFIID subunit 2 [Ceratocystis lukuohia]|uniref:Transcription initiation factor TFIID subunit 2 n=1 Tax=Ceratocystis lukuohia TaxID=2019550 RepID=A0ABR4MKN0_9PEZI